MDHERLRREAIRVNLRYTVEVVEAYGLCPWARSARDAARVRRAVVFGAGPVPSRALAAVAEIAADERVEVGLLLFPQIALDRYGFQRFTSELRERDAARYPPGETPMAMAPFHPDAEPDTRSPGRLISFVRRTPDPTIQLVRRSALAAVRRSAPAGTTYACPAVQSPSDWEPPGQAPLHERIAEVNHRTVMRVGVERMAALLDDIRADRDRAYAALFERDHDAPSGREPGCAPPSERATDRWIDGNQ